MYLLFVGESIILVLILYAPFAYFFSKLGFYTPKSVRIANKAKKYGRYTTASLQFQGTSWATYEYSVSGVDYTVSFNDTGVVVPQEVTVYWKRNKPERVYSELEVVYGYLVIFWTAVPVVLWLICYFILGVYIWL